jgi:branched-subunit amino acid transport protein
MSFGVALVMGCAVLGAAIKLVGPVFVGGRQLPEPFTAVVMLLAPALLASLVVTQTLADGQHLGLGLEAAGVAAGGLVAWRTKSPAAAVIVAAAVTAALRLV